MDKPARGVARRRRGVFIVVSVVLAIIVFAFTTAVSLGINNSSTSRTSFQHQAEVSQMYSSYLYELLTMGQASVLIGYEKPNSDEYHNTTIKSTACVAGGAAAENGPEHYLLIIEEAIRNSDAILARLRREQERAKRRAPRLRRANKRFKRLIEHSESVIDIARAFLGLYAIDPHEATETISLPHNVGEEGFLDQKVTIEKYLKSYTDAIERVNTKSHKTAFTASILALVLTLVAFIMLLATLLSLARAQYLASKLREEEFRQRFEREEAEAKINSQDRLVRQQAHEMRNRFGPAVAMMGAFLEASTYDEYRALRQDMASALSVLKEVEKHQQTRLDVYKILKGNYELQYEIFDLTLLLNERCGAEWTIARLLKPPSLSTGSGLSPRNSITSTTENKSGNVRFCVGLPSSCYEQGEIPEISVKTDVYILSHLLNNLLSNSRKHTYVGAITVFFLGTNNDKLIFQVRDDGVGIPLEIRDKLFAGADVATADLRGTGLGLSSCQVFARCAEGYVRLVKSELQDATNDHGYSVFEFAVKGEVLKNKAAYIYNPKKSQKFIVRDAVYDCTEQDENESTTVISSSNSSLHNGGDDASNGNTNTCPSTLMNRRQLLDDADDDKKEDVALLISEENDGEIETEEDAIIPNNAQVIIIDDSGINRSCVRRSINVASISLKLSGFEFFEYETCESAQPHLTRVARNPNVIVTIDQSLQSRGGVLTGTDLIQWLTKSLKFEGILISSSGDAFIGHEHLALGAHAAWGKPLPSKKNVQTDLVTCFTKQHERRRLNHAKRKAFVAGSSKQLDVPLDI